MLFASNTLEIVVPPDNPAGIESFQDLAEPGLNLVVCAPEVPCGAAAQAAAEAAGVELKPVSEEQSVTDVLDKVTTGEADAGLVYVTDVIAAGDDVQGIEFPESERRGQRLPDRHRRRQRERRPGRRSSWTWCSATPASRSSKRPGSASPDVSRTHATSALPTWIYLPAAVGAAFVLLPLAAIVSPGRLERVPRA